MSERISRRKFLVLVGLGTGAVVAGALSVKELLSSGNGKEKTAVVKNPTAEPTQNPPATETIKPTPTPSPEPIPTVAPTEVPVETPATIEEVRDAFSVAYSKLDSATLASLPLNQTQAYIEDRLSVCNGEVAISDIPPDSPNYGTALISSCTIIPQEINGIPGREDILEFSVALERLGSFTLDKVDMLWKDGKFPGATEEELQNYKIDVAAYFPK